MTWRVIEWLISLAIVVFFAREATLPGDEFWDAVTLAIWGHVLGLDTARVMYAWSRR